jgi:hypothetical protein
MTTRKTFDRGTVQARAQEISCSSLTPITVRDACKQALHELYGNNADALLDAAATLAAGTMSGLRQRTYQLPEQVTLTSDIPGVIGITTPDGDLIIPRSEATAAQVRQWGREAVKHHSTQRLRFKRFNEDLDIAGDQPDEVRWTEMRPVIEERKLKILEAGK